MRIKPEHQYVAARLWKPDEPVTFDNLCIYTYGGEILTGTLESAKGFCEYAARMSKEKDAETNPYKPYKITFEEWT